MKKYLKHSVRHLLIEEVVTETKQRIVSYELILNKIGELERDLEKWKDLKKEAIKLKLVR